MCFWNSKYVNIQTIHFIQIYFIVYSLDISGTIVYCKSVFWQIFAPPILHRDCWSSCSCQYYFVIEIAVKLTFSRLNGYFFLRHHLTSFNNSFLILASHQKCRWYIPPARNFFNNIYTWQQMLPSGYNPISCTSDHNKDDGLAFLGETLWYARLPCP